MLNYEVRIRKRADLKGAVRLIERLCAEEGLEQTVKRTLRSYPGSVHWHYGHPERPGTVEVIFWPAESRIWLSVHANRTSAWARATARTLSRTIEGELRKKQQASGINSSRRN